MIQKESPSAEAAKVLRFEVQEGAKGAAVLGSDHDRETVHLWSQVVWDFYLNRDHDSAVAPFGSAARLLLQKWRNEKDKLAWVVKMKARLESSFTILENISETLWKLMKDFNQSAQLSSEAEQRMRNEASKLNELWNETDFVTRLVESNLSSDANAFVRIRQRKDSLQEVFELFFIQKNLLRVLEQELKERGALHGARA